MEVGVAIAIYISIFIIITILFILVTRYFNFRLRKALTEGAQFEMIQGLKADEEEITQSEYQMFLKENLPQFEKNPNKVTLDKEVLDEINGIRSSFKPKQNSVYQSPAMITPASTNSKRSDFSMRPDRLDTPLSNASSPKKFSISQKNNDKSIRKAFHSYISLMVAYNEEGLVIVEKDVHEIWKPNEFSEIQEKGDRKEVKIPKSDSSFKETLESYGFEDGNFGAFKYTVNIQIPNMKIGKVYSIDSLKTSTQKQSMQFHSFIHEYGHYEEQQQKRIKV